MPDKPKDTKKVGISYIVTFYEEISSLNQFYSQYLNLMLEFKHKYNATISEGISLDEEDRTRLNNALQTIRHFAHKSIVQYKALKKIIDKEKSKDKILELYEKEIKSIYILNENRLEEFVDHLNSCLVQEVIKDLLESNQDLVAAIYGGSTTNQ